MMIPESCDADAAGVETAAYIIYFPRGRKIYLCEHHLRQIRELPPYTIVTRITPPEQQLRAVTT